MYGSFEKNIPVIKSQTKRPKVRVEITCNTTETFSVSHGTSLKSLLTKTCHEFGLQPGTVDLWRVPLRPCQGHMI